LCDLVELLVPGVRLSTFGDTGTSGFWQAAQRGTETATNPDAGIEPFRSAVDMTFPVVSFIF
jgi:hypothetical protein